MTPTIIYLNFFQKSKSERNQTMYRICYLKERTTVSFPAENPEINGKKKQLSIPKELPQYKTNNKINFFRLIYLFLLDLVKIQVSNFKKN